MTGPDRGSLAGWWWRLEKWVRIWRGAEGLQWKQTRGGAVPAVGGSGSGTCIGVSHGLVGTARQLTEVS